MATKELLKRLALLAGSRGNGLATSSSVSYQASTTTITAPYDGYLHCRGYSNNNANGWYNVGAGSWYFSADCNADATRKEVLLPVTKGTTYTINKSENLAFDFLRLYKALGTLEGGVKPLKYLLNFVVCGVKNGVH